MTLSLFRTCTWGGCAFLALALGCVSRESDTGGTSLYVFDSSSSATNRILIWSDVDRFRSASSTAAPDRTLRGAILDNVMTLGWGGMCLDSRLGRLFLVSETGHGVRIDRIRSQSGTLSTTTGDVITFQLKPVLSGSKFGQAAVDTTTGALYVTEYTSSDSRLWMVTDGYSSGDTLDSSSSLVAKVFSVSGDMGGTGVAAGAGSFYAFFSNGSQVNGGGTPYDGARIRKGNSAGFSFNANSNVIIGGSTLLNVYGSLAWDSSNQRLYMGRHLVDAGVSDQPILVFQPAQFSGAYNPAPYRTLGSASLSNARVIAHAGIRDWLAAAGSNGDSGSNRVWIFSQPSNGGAPICRDLDTSIAIRGLALDGGN